MWHLVVRALFAANKAQKASKKAKKKADKELKAKRKNPSDGSEQPKNGRDVQRARETAKSDAEGQRQRHKDLMKQIASGQVSPEKAKEQIRLNGRVNRSQLRQKNMVNHCKHRYRPGSKQRRTDPVEPLSFKEVQAMRREYRRTKRLAACLQCLEAWVCNLGIADCWTCFGLSPLVCCFHCCLIWIYPATNLGMRRGDLDAHQTSTQTPDQVPRLSARALGRREVLRAGDIKWKLTALYLLYDLGRLLFLPELFILVPLKLASTCCTRCCRDGMCSRCFPTEAKLYSGTEEAQRKQEREAAKLEKQGGFLLDEELIQALHYRDIKRALRVFRTAVDRPLSGLALVRDYQHSLEAQIEEQGFRLTNRERLSAARPKKLAIVGCIFLLVIIVLEAAIFVSAGHDEMVQLKETACSSGGLLDNELGARICDYKPPSAPDLPSAGDLKGDLPDDLPKDLPNASRWARRWSSSRQLGAWR